MARYAYERLSAQDNSFLLMEQPNVHMHVAATQIFETGPLKTEEGGIDFSAMRRSIESVLHLIPRYRQVLQWIPLANHPVWVDDSNFSIDYHVRHTSLPRPGTSDQLKKLAARIMAQQLDKRKPLWEYWVIEGLDDGDRFAVVTKIHHCMIDGSSGVDLAQILMSFTPDRDLPDPLPYIPRPAPSNAELLADQLARRMTLPLQALNGIRALADEAGSIRDDFLVRLQALRELASYAVRSASQTPLNGKLGPHRYVDWLVLDLDELKAVRRKLECTVNDVVLATVTGAVRNYMIRRRVDPNELDFRVSAPVSVRRDEDRGKLGNKVSSWIVPLPLNKSKPLEQLNELHKRTEELKRSKQALGVEMLMAAAEWAPAQLISLGAQATSGPINMIVTNVPGPQMPLYTMGAKLLEMYPQVPLLDNTGLGIALVSYNGKVYWGFNSDPDLVTDLPVFVQEVKAAFAALKRAAVLQSVSDNARKSAKDIEKVERIPIKALARAKAVAADIASDSGAGATAAKEIGGKRNVTKKTGAKKASTKKANAAKSGGTKPSAAKPGAKKSVRKRTAKKGSKRAARSRRKKDW